MAGLILVSAAGLCGFMPRVEPRPSEDSLQLVRAKGAVTRSDERKENSPSKVGSLCDARSQEKRQRRIARRSLSRLHP